MNNYKSNIVITVITDSVPSTCSYYKEKIKAFVRPLLRKIDGKKPLIKPAYGGHYAVTRSFIDGLKRQSIPFVYNPQRKKDCTKEVIVLAGLAPLQQMLTWRKEGKVKNLAAGPNLVVTPSDNAELLCSDYLDTLIVNSEWVKSLYCLEMPHLASKTIIWPAGIDEIFWSPSESPKNKTNILFYNKRPEEQLYKNCIDIAKKMGFTVSEIKYGAYSTTEYKKALNENSLLVHFVEQESQGISILEAWAMNVPTFIWNPGFFHIKGLNVISSSAPNMTDKTGLFFRNAEDFKNVMIQYKNSQTDLSPRECVLQNMTDSYTSERLLSLVYEAWQNNKQYN